ncbi:NADH-ubiquinone oxidoreductase-related protein [Artemisia annua]|uniref:NADH-ubiquinone oxidoreductase-related protein n=1 Tax=Artemisia annua TaxID=35608 RepID=A0A2U1P4V6_ARTAN|nr:NADH-ubiquinone oxidoreductase-related protein [Artemisia annua]
MFLRRFARPSSLKMMSAAAAIVGQKVGPEVVPNSREVLIGLYTKTLNIITRVPEDEGYRISMESLTRQRLAVCESEKDVENIEKKIGKVDELIEEAKFEYKVLDKLLVESFVSVGTGVSLPRNAFSDLTVSCSPIIVVWHFRLHYVKLKVENDFQAMSFKAWHGDGCWFSEWDPWGVNDDYAFMKQDNALPPIYHRITFNTSITIHFQWDPWGVNDDYISEEMQNGIEIPKPAPVHSRPLPEDFFATLKAAANVKSCFVFRVTIVNTLFPAEVSFLDVNLAIIYLWENYPCSKLQGTMPVVSYIFPLGTAKQSKLTHSFQRRLVYEATTPLILNQTKTFW